MTDIIETPCPHAMLRRIAENKRYKDWFDALDLAEVNLGVRYDLSVPERQIGWDAEWLWCEENVGPHGEDWHHCHWRYKFADPIRAAQFKLIFHSDRATDPEAKYR